MEALFYVLGIAICGCVLLQLSLWTTGTLASIKHNRQQLRASRRLIGEQLDSVKRKQNDVANTDHTWKGYREFVVAKLEKAAEGITSVYFAPIDQKPIPSFKSGQHLPLKFHVPGESKQLVRCYSLSSGPRTDFYRISVKAVPTPPNRPELPAGRVSNFINSQLMVGDRVEAKSPSGSFVLDPNGTCPIVLLAGGIGITPIFSMLEDLVACGTERTIVVLYGVKYGREHAFKDQIAQVSSGKRNVHVVNCYSDPEANDRANIDYQYKGWVSADLIKQLMPNNQCMFYLCGPPPFMSSLQSGLAEWGVPENRIHFEAFGPATVKKAAPKIVSENDAKQSVDFARTGKNVAWDSQFESILEMAEANEIAVDSGCRAGSCKTCAIPLIEGKVSYPDGMDVDCEPGECLPCIATPNGDVKLDV